MWGAIAAGAFQGFLGGRDSDSINAAKNELKDKSINVLLKFVKETGYNQDQFMELKLINIIKILQK